MEIRARTKVGYNHWILSYGNRLLGAPLSNLGKSTRPMKGNGKSVTGQCTGLTLWRNAVILPP
eukprot:342622-Prymnesium_polylepis.1